MADHPQCTKLFSDLSHYAREHRAYLSDILRPYWKDSPFDDGQRQRMYGLSGEDFLLVDKLADAGLAILPMTWNHYLQSGQLSRAQGFIQAARRAARPVLSYVSGDEGVTIPSGFDDVWVVRASGFRSRRQKRQVAQPVFFEDPLKSHPELESYGQPAGAANRPVVGFCGQASVNAVKLVGDLIRVCFRNTAYRLRIRLEEPQPLYPTALLRARALQVVRRSPLIKTQFVIRSRYRAGASEPDSLQRTARDFYENVAQTDYTLCVRGGGNFSKRFYETLAMGRIPALVDTDCVLPFESTLTWKDYIVSAGQNEIAKLPHAIVDHFSRHEAMGLERLKRGCRGLWEESLSFGGFHRRLVRQILSPAEAADPCRITKDNSNVRPAERAMESARV